MGELRAEFPLSLELIEQMAALLKKQVGEARENSQRDHLLDPASDFLLKIMKQYQEGTEDEGEDEEIPLSQMTLSSSSVETQCYTSLTFEKSTNCELEDIWFDAHDIPETSLQMTKSAEEETKAALVDNAEDEPLLESKRGCWTYKQELTRWHNKEEHGGKRSYVSKQNPKTGQMDTIKKITTHLSDFFRNHKLCKWERLEDED